MPGASARAEVSRGTRQSDLQALDAMAALARQTGSPVHVIVARAPGVVEHARRAALRTAVGMAVDLRPLTIRVRFAACRADGGS